MAPQRPKKRESQEASISLTFPSCFGHQPISGKGKGKADPVSAMDAQANAAGVLAIVAQASVGLAIRPATKKARRRPGRLSLRDHFSGLIQVLAPPRTAREKRRERRNGGGLCSGKAG